MLHRPGGASGRGARAGKAGVPLGGQGAAGVEVPRRELGCRAGSRELDQCWASRLHTSGCSSEKCGGCCKKEGERLRLARGGSLRVERTVGPHSGVPRGSCIWGLGGSWPQVAVLPSLLQLGWHRLAQAGTGRQRKRRAGQDGSSGSTTRAGGVTLSSRRPGTYWLGAAFPNRAFRAPRCSLQPRGPGFLRCTYTLRASRAANPSVT